MAASCSWRATLPTSTGRRRKRPGSSASTASEILTSRGRPLRRTSAGWTSQRWTALEPSDEAGGYLQAIRARSVDAWYEAMCNFTLENDGWGAYDAGAVSSSGWGDGMYPVYGAEVDRKWWQFWKPKRSIVALQLSFIPQDSEDPYWDQEDPEDDD